MYWIQNKYSSFLYTSNRFSEKGIGNLTLLTSKLLIKAACSSLVHSYILLLNRASSTIKLAICYACCIEYLEWSTSLCSLELCGAWNPNCTLSIRCANPKNGM